TCAEAGGLPPKRSAISENGRSGQKKEIIATTPRAAKSSTCRKLRRDRTAEGKLPSEETLALPGGPSELPAPRRHGQAPAGELVDLLPDLAADVLRERGCSIVETRHHVVRRRRPVVKKATALVPDQRPVARIHPVAQLEQGDLACGLPDD